MISKFTVPKTTWQGREFLLLAIITFYAASVLFQLLESTQRKKKWFSRFKKKIIISMVLTSSLYWEIPTAAQNISFDYLIKTMLIIIPPYALFLSSH